VAASAGIDSTVLAHGLSLLPERCDVGVAIGHVNHGLRAGESDGDEAAVAELASALSAPFLVRRVEPQGLRENRSSRDRPTLQEAARTLRYRALLELCTQAGCGHVVTAHNADDQAETVLLRLMRGAGPDGLGGIPEVARCGRVVRPLLFVSRAEIHAYALRHRLAWREDTSNRDGKYARNRLRNDWLPGLAADFNPQLLRAIGNLAEAQRRDAEWIDELVSREADLRFCRRADSLGIARGGWGDLPEALARRLARRALLELGGGRDVSRSHLERFVAFLRSGRSGSVLELPGGLRLHCDSAEFRLEAVRVKAPSPC
jgi:tRNA(Ile)-lysidine synthase